MQLLNHPKNYPIIHGNCLVNQTFTAKNFFHCKLSHQKNEKNKS